MDKRGQLVCEMPGRFSAQVFSIHSGLTLVLLDIFFFFFFFFQSENFLFSSELHEVFVSPFLQSLCIP